MSLVACDLLFWNDFRHGIGRSVKINNLFCKYCVPHKQSCPGKSKDAEWTRKNQGM